MTLLNVKTIKRKLMSIIMVTCVVALLLASAAIVTYENADYMRVLQRNSDVIARIIANDSVAPLTFKDKTAGGDALGALKAEPYVISASIYDKSGQPFVTYTRNPTEKSAMPPTAPSEESMRFDKDYLHVFRKIIFDGEAIGMLYIQSDLRAVTDRFQTYLGIIATVVLSTMVVTFFLSLRLQKHISGPILHLADVANKVSSEQNYSIRARETTNDELGQLVLRFNDMLRTIQERDADLSKAHDQLERRVDERTKELQSEVAERTRAEAALRVEQRKFESLVNSIDGVVWEASATDFSFRFVSEQAERLLGFPRSDWTASPDFWKRCVHPDDFSSACDLRRKAGEKANHFEYRMLAADGRVVWIREISAQVIEDCSPAMFRGVLFDITEQKKAEAEVDLLNRRLLESSRHAGMAEVATGVLHNVGNVLNSVNVSSTLICDQVRNSKAARLKDVAAMLNSNSANLAFFITQDPKGKIIPTYLTTLSERLAAEQSGLLKELELLTKNIEHIKEIVAMQQNYARVSGVVEMLSMKDLVEDALQMNVAALSRHGITVVRNYENVPPMPVDKHKILQIFVNLIRNAKYAIDAAARSEKRLEITIRKTAHDRVAVIFTDNGIGIAKENLTRIFSHGFTTKKDGHGFGLHSGALAAKAMGGALIAASDGPAQGASFTLELPLTAPKPLSVDRN